MMRIFKRAFNSVIFNLSITAVFIVIAILVYQNKIQILKKFQAIDRYKVFLAMLLISFFFFFNFLFIFKNKHTYLTFLTFMNIWAILFFGAVLTALIVFFYLILKNKNFEKDPLWFSYLYFIAISYTAVAWSVYLNFCIRVLSSINVKCSVFVATTVKAILIAIVAWFALYKDLGMDENGIINFFVSYISLCYPLLDMYKYVRLELDKYMEDNNNPIKIKSHSD